MKRKERKMEGRRGTKEKREIEKVERKEGSEILGIRMNNKKIELWGCEKTLKEGYLWKVIEW